MKHKATKKSGRRDPNPSRLVEHALYGQRLLLLPERTLFWMEKKMLVVADAHFGKAQLFRERGIPVPQGTTAADLERLSRLMDDLQPRKLLFLGDLTHGPIDNPDVYVRRITPWRQRYRDIELLLVSGNHDRQGKAPPAPFGFDWVGKVRHEGPFVFTHQPQDTAAGYNLAGHLHPAVAMSGRGGLKASLPCFCFGPQRALLPAFGSFTGCQVIRPEAEDQVFVIADDAVIAPPARAAAGR